MRDILIWCVITVVGVLFQYYFTGIDLYLPALIVFFQKRYYIKGTLMALSWIIIQEGCSSLPFGSFLMWYMGTIFFYFWVKEFLSEYSLIFVFILSCISSGIYYISVLTIADLSNIDINLDLAVVNSIKCLFLFPVFWWCYIYLYKKFFPQNGFSFE